MKAERFVAIFAWMMCAACIAVQPDQIETRTTAGGDTQYRARLRGVSYVEILNQYANLLEMELKGNLPAGIATFDAGDEWMTLDALTARLRSLLLNSWEQVWLVHYQDKGCLRIVCDFGCRISMDAVFPSVVDFASSTRPPTSLSLVQMQPSIDVGRFLKRLHNWAPLHLRIAHKQGENALLMFGMTQDVRHYLALARLLDDVSEDQQVRMIYLESDAADNPIAILEDAGYDVLVHDNLEVQKHEIPVEPVVHSTNMLTHVSQAYHKISAWPDPAFSRIAVRAKLVRMPNIVRLLSESEKN